MKTKMFAAMAVAMLSVLGAKTMANDNVNYEFETYKGEKVLISTENICCQVSETNVLESATVPQDAEVIAPGRDFVYLADANYYYVEDATRGLLTVARKDNSTKTAYLGLSFLVSYQAKSFTVNSDRDNVTLAYTREGVQAAGSNYAMFTLVDEPSSMSYLQQVQKKEGAEQSVISEMMVSGAKGYVYQTVSESKESGLKVVLAHYAVPCGGKTMAIEVFRTLSQDEGTEMAIDADFEQMFQSFLVLK